MKEFLWELISDITGWDCIWAYENGTMPPKFIMLNIISTSGFGDDRKKRSFDEENKLLKNVISGIKESTLSLNAYGVGANEVLSTLWQSLNKESILDRCFFNGVSVIDASSVQDLTDLLDDLTYEERAQIDLTVSFTQETPDDINIIETININGTLSHPKNIEKDKNKDLITNFDIKIDGNQ